MGSAAGFGYRRALLKASGKIRVLKGGEHKNLRTDRVTLIPGQAKEVAGVKLMFSMCADGWNCTDIARELDRRDIPASRGGRWKSTSVKEILMNPKYVGCNVWHRRTQRLHSSRTSVKPEYWIAKPSAFPAIVDQITFERAQASLKRLHDSHWTSEKALQRVRRLLKAEGSLNGEMFRKSRGMPSNNTIRRFFGTLRALYEEVGYKLHPRIVFRVEQAKRSECLRSALIDQINLLFRDHLNVVMTRRGKRPILLIDKQFVVAILLCDPATGFLAPGGI